MAWKNRNGCIKSICNSFILFKTSHFKSSQKERATLSVRSLPWHRRLCLSIHELNLCFRSRNQERLSSLKKTSSQSFAHCTASACPLVHTRWPPLHTPPAQWAHEGAISGASGKQPHTIHTGHGLQSQPLLLPKELTNHLYWDGASVCQTKQSLLDPYWIPIAFLLHPYWIPTGSLLHRYWIPTASLPDPYRIPTGSLLHPYWIPTATLLVGQHVCCSQDSGGETSTGASSRSFQGFKTCKAFAICCQKMRKEGRP